MPRATARSTERHTKAQGDTAGKARWGEAKRSEAGLGEKRQNRAGRGEAAGRGANKNKPKRRKCAKAWQGRAKQGKTKWGEPTKMMRTKQSGTK